MLTGLLVLVGCMERPANQPSTFSVSDSSGIIIAQSVEPAWGEGEGWVVESQPLLVIGEERGDDPYLFSQVEGALRLSDGGFVVADGRSRELRYFDSGGRFLISAGGEGNGPGELPTLRSIARCGDAGLYAFDVRYRARIFDESGEWLRTLPQIVLPAGTPPQNLSCGGRGRFLIVGWDPRMLRGITGHYRSQVPVTIHDEEGAVLAELGTFGGYEYVGSTEGAAPYAFSHLLVHALEEESALVGTGDSYELRVFGPSGHLQRVIRWDGPDLHFTDSDVEHYKERRRATAAPARRQEVERELRDWVRPDRWPAYRSLLVDAEGVLWVEDYDRSRSERVASRWTILNPEGALLGRLSTPMGLRVTEVGDDYLLGIVEDEVGVERVALHRLRR